MVREILYVGEVVEVSDYEECHRYKNQKHLVHGVPVDPVMRSDFERTPHDEREALEKEDWWDRPYVKTCSWDEYISHSSEWESVGYSGEDPPEVYSKQRWFSLWPTGTRYEVRCMNGWAWDGSTVIGIEANLDDAIGLARTAMQPDVEKS